MKKLLFYSVLLLYTLTLQAQGAPQDSAKIVEYQVQIGLDLSVPDFETRMIDEKKMGTRLASLLRYFEENSMQFFYNRCMSSILQNQYEELKNVYFEITKLKLQSATKVGNEITVKYKVWLSPNTKNVKQTIVTFHFIDGVSESKLVNEMFSNMSRYVQARDLLNK